MFKVVIVTYFLLINISFGISGYELAFKMNNRNIPIDSKMDLTMNLTNKKGKKRSYIIHSIVKDNAKKQMMWFLEPLADKGISFLKIEHNNKDDEMYIWLPAFKKSRRISAKKKSDSFMGSDISYEDLTNRQIDNYMFNVISQENYDTIPCFLLESIPKNKIITEYSRHVTWVDTISYVSIKEESFDKKNELLKKKLYTYTDINGYHILSKINIINVQKNHSTILKFKNIELNNNIKDNFFHKRNLKHLPK